MDNTNEKHNIVYDFTIGDLFKAYFDCRRNKRCKRTQLKFELNLEKNLMKLYKEIKSGKYEIGKSICFVVTRPKPREVWAANFRDRIVHHLVYNFISERYYKKFIHDTYSCIPKRGTLAAAKRLLHFCRSATRNYTRPAYYLKADLSNFFVSINKDILFKFLQEEIHEEWLLHLLKQILYNDPTKKVFKKSSPQKFKLIPDYKSLFNADLHHGLPIGNLTSQFFSNIYLNKLDKFIKQNLKCKYYLRYVDDFIIIELDTKLLNDYFTIIDDFLSLTLEINVNKRKKLLNKINCGVDFVGYIIKPHRIFLRQATLRRIFEIIRLWKNLYNQYLGSNLMKFFRTINSYLGMAVNITAFNIRFLFGKTLRCLFIHTDLFCTKTVLSAVRI